MNIINPTAVNTLRIVTINKHGNVELFSSELRVGIKKTGYVDNAAAGGIVIGVLESGKLNKYGLCKYGDTFLLEAHPDTNFIFENYQIENYNQILDIVKKAHEKFYNVHSIGWDIALSDSGVYFIEGNDNWEISGLQMANGPLRKKWKKALEI